MDGIKTIKVGLLGCGTVGGGVAIVLNENREDITRRSGCRIEIAKVLLRNAADPNEIVRKYGLPVTDRIEDIVEDPDIQIVVELMGRIHPAKEYIEAALAHGKMSSRPTRTSLRNTAKSFWAWRGRRASISNSKDPSAAASPSSCP